MLQKLLSLDSSSDPRQVLPSGNSMTIINFDLLPAGWSNASRPSEVGVNDDFSNVVMETVKLLLNSACIRKGARTYSNFHAQESAINQDEMVRLQKLMDFIKESIKSGKVKMGGRTPN